MVLSDDTSERLEAFFRHYLEDPTLTLPVLTFHFNFWVDLFTRLCRIDAITLGTHIFVASRLITFEQFNRPKLPGALVAHEVVHTRQYLKEGTLRFLVTYVGAFLRGIWRMRNHRPGSLRQSYLSIPYEEEAIRTAASYALWSSAKRLVQTTVQESNR
jgi:hypothetical protein